MKTIMSLFLMSVIFIGSSAVAQQDPDDPGIQDSLIVGSASVDSGATFCFVPVYAVTDDSVEFYNLPLRWNAPNGGVFIAEDNQYFAPLTYWPLAFDSVYVENDFVRQVGWANGDPSLSLVTHGVRAMIWSMRLIINPLTPPQIVTLDSTWDDRNYSTLIGLRHGLIEIFPAFVAGHIIIGNPLGIGGDVNPLKFQLAQNYPNPFNSATSIQFTVAENGHATLIIYDITGQEIRKLIDSSVASGDHQAIWDGTNNFGEKVTSGIYYYRLESGGVTKIKKMTLLR
jgi:hypothetical protein